MKNYDKRLLVTGGAGFIGSHLVRHLVHKYPNYYIINLDALTYAGNLENLRDIEGKENYIFCKADITNFAELEKVFDHYKPTDVLHLAAESHVDKSIHNPLQFVYTNVIGTVHLLNLANAHLTKNGGRYYQISTDEVYGSLGDTGFFTESTPYSPRSPYSASKASADHFVRAYQHTYGMDIVISNCSNNYGPYQFPEKLLPLIINNILLNKPLPVYGEGKNTRDWLYVQDHVEAIDLVFHKGKPGGTYNVGGSNEWKNIDLVYHICGLMDYKLGRVAGTSAGLITFVKDRSGHDLRYAIDASLIQQELGWRARHSFDEGIHATIDWYLSNKEWLGNVTSGEYLSYYNRQYGL